jgi:hypothetical protein
MPSAIDWHHRKGNAFEQAASDEPVTSDELNYLLPDQWLASNPAHAWAIDNFVAVSASHEVRSYSSGQPLVKSWAGQSSCDHRQSRRRYILGT